MLSGGHGEVLPMSGGGFSLMALGKPVEPEVDTPAPPAPSVGGDPIGDAMGKAYAKAAAPAAPAPATAAAPKFVAKPVIEYYEVKAAANQPLQKYTDSMVKTMLKDPAAANEVVEAYRTKSEANWTVGIPAPKLDTDPKNNLVHFLPTDGQLDNIVILPAVKGKLERFDYLLTFLTKIGVVSGVQDEIGTIAERNRVIFMPPFYGEGLTTAGSNANVALSYMFMKFKEINPRKVFYLAEQNPETLTAATNLNKAVSSTNPTLLALLEPSHIRYTDPVGPFIDGIYITSSNLGTLPRQPGTEPYVSYTPNGATRLPFNNAIMINTTEQTPITGVGGLGQCDTLLSEVDVSGISKPYTIGLKNGDRIAVIRLLVPPDRKPLCKQKSILDGAPLFAASEIKALAKAPKVSFFYNNQLYRIRKPLGKVVSNWVAGVFTPGGNGFRGEAEYLRDMGLSPKLLREVFGDMWVDELTAFLKSLSVSKCFSDTGLLTYKECKVAREFITSIRNKQDEMKDDMLDLEPFVQAAPVTIPNSNNMVLEEVKPGGFSSYFKIGSHGIHPTLDGRVMPVMIINRSTGEYILRHIEIRDPAATDEDIKAYLAMYKQQYTDWIFLT